jgi:hypothetical protein
MNHKKVPQTLNHGIASQGVGRAREERKEWYWAF